MNPTSLLLTPERRLRAPWRLALFILILFVTVLIGAFIEGGADWVALKAGYKLEVSEWGGTLGVLIGTAVALKWVEGKDWDYVGMDRASAEPGLLGQGAVFGLVGIAVPSLLLLSIGELKSVPAASGSSLAAAGLSFANLLPAAFGEELLLRGYIFAVLREAIGWRWTLISTSVVFGLLHIWNPGSDGQAIVIVMLAGFFLGSIFLATRSLYAATAAHFVWNWFMAAGLHTPVSGLAVSTPDYQVVDAGPDWLTGGRWGPEGGFAAAVAMFVLLIYLHARPLRRLES